MNNADGVFTNYFNGSVSDPDNSFVIIFPRIGDISSIISLILSKNVEFKN